MSKLSLLVSCHKKAMTLEPKIHKSRYKQERMNTQNWT